MEPSAPGHYHRDPQLVAGGRPALILGVAFGLAYGLVPWSVLYAAGLSVPGHMLVTAHLLLGLVVVVLATRSAAGVGAYLAALSLTLGGAVFIALADMSQVLPFSMGWDEVRALQSARLLIGGAAVVASLRCLVEAVHHAGDRRSLDLSFASLCALVGVAAAMWQPGQGVTHPMALSAS